PEDFDADKVLWFMDGTYLEFYTYYESGRIQFKDVYEDIGGVWTWKEAAGYLDQGDIPWGGWDDWKTRAETGAPETYPPLPDKPDRADTDPLFSEGEEEMLMSTPEEPETQSAAGGSAGDELLSKNSAVEKSQDQFTGYTPEEDGYNESAS
ncbi:MAG: hypothetical protein DRP09_18940, partial [Candidatus Thorarchaeota archaeon]